MNRTTIRERIPNGRGLNLSTELFVPESKTPVPVVFIFHGFTGYKESPDLVDLSHKLAEKGMCAVRFTASGFGDSDGTIDDDYRFSNHRNDAEKIYDYVIHEAYVDPARIGVYGNSLGGKLAILFAKDHPDVQALCVTSAPVTFHRSGYAEIRQNGVSENPMTVLPKYKISESTKVITEAIAAPPIPGLSL